MTVLDCRLEPIWHYCAAAAWFVQMGVHEGMHAHAAYRRGDTTADFLGKRTFNPLAHIEWGSLNGWLASVVIPIVTSFYFGFPLGMAWVPVNPYNFRHPRRDHAFVAIAGPGGNLLVCAAALAVHHAVLGWLPQSSAVVAIDTFFCALYFTSVAYGLFNLIPIPPLDGSRVAYWFAAHPVRRLFDAIEPFGFLLVVVLFQVAPGVRRTFWTLVAEASRLYA